MGKCFGSQTILSTSTHHIISPRLYRFTFFNKIITFIFVGQVSCDKPKVEESLDIQNFFESLQTRIQNATHTLEGVLGVDIPTTQAEIKAVLDDNIKGLKENAEKIQKKVNFKT